MLSAKQRKPNVSNSNVFESSIGSISKEKYQIGDFVSIDQYVVKTPARLHDVMVFRGAGLHSENVAKFSF